MMGKFPWKTAKLKVYGCWEFVIWFNCIICNLLLISSYINIAEGVEN